jgi:hypothetical protein
MKKTRYWACVNDIDQICEYHGRTFIFSSRDAARSFRTELDDYHATKEIKISFVKK